LYHYAFERKGRSPFYPKIAAKIVKNYKEEISQDCFVKDIWDRFLKELNNSESKPNKNLNPLFKFGNQTTITEFIKTICEKHDYNLLKWIKMMLEEGYLEEVFNQLVKVRGIGPKIASFYLRDITYAFELEKVIDKKNARYIQPIDVWTRRAAKVWANNQKKSDKGYAEIIIQKCEEVGASYVLVNTGLWFLGSQICKLETLFNKILIDGIKELKRVLKKKEEEWNKEIKLVKLLQKTSNFIQSYPDMID
jgi:endonuclease III